MGETTLTVEQLATHSHSIYTRATVQSGGTENPPLDANGPAQDYVTSEVGGSQPHTHTLSGASGAADSLPPYYALALIMRIA